MVTDEDTSSLWVGHACGRVTGFSLHKPGACIKPRQIAQWQVRRPRGQPALQASQRWVPRTTS